MSVLVKGMEMPKRCEDCLMYRHNAEYDYAYCCISSVNVLGHGNARLNNCPLVEVPTPHGRLIDADKLYEVISLNYKDLDSTEDFMGIGYDHCIGDTLIVIRQASTIIEAEDE